MATAHGPDVATLAALLHESNLNDSFPTGLVDTCTAISDLIDMIVHLPTNPLSLFLDLEGVQLSRHGSISILQVHICTDDRTYLIDIHTLGDKAFSTSGAGGETLKGIQESEFIPKVFFDVRNDSDAL
jgi:exonuclease 3'-5' domain-containing protein 1